MNVKLANTLFVVIAALLLSGCNTNRAPNKNAPIFVRAAEKQTEKTNDDSLNNARAVQAENSFRAVPETKDFVVVRVADLEALKKDKNSDAPKVNAIEVNNVRESSGLSISARLQEPVANSSQRVFASDLHEQNDNVSKPSAFVTFLHYILTVAVVFCFVLLVKTLFFSRKARENTVKFPEKKN